MAVEMTILFWVVTPCRPVGKQPACRRNIICLFSGLKKETPYFSQTLVSTYVSTG